MSKQRTRTRISVILYQDMASATQRYKIGKVISRLPIVIKIAIRPYVVNAQICLALSMVFATYYAFVAISQQALAALVAPIRPPILYFSALIAWILKPAPRFALRLRLALSGAIAFPTRYMRGCCSKYLMALFALAKDTTSSFSCLNNALYRAITLRLVILRSVFFAAIFANDSLCLSISRVNMSQRALARAEFSAPIRSCSSELNTTSGTNTLASLHAAYSTAFCRAMHLLIALAAKIELFTTNGARFHWKFPLQTFAIECGQACKGLAVRAVHEAALVHFLSIPQNGAES